MTLPISPPVAPPAAPELPRPASVSTLFWAFSGMALQGFGGVLTVVQRELVERRRWLSAEGFLADWALAQVLPGPNVCNLAMIYGGRCFGWRGAVAALAGLLCLPLLVALGLLWAYQQGAHLPAVAGAVRGMTAVAVGLIIGASLKLAKPLKHHPMGAGWCAGMAGLTLLAITGWRWPLHAAILGLGGVACVWTGWTLHRQAQRGPQA